MYKISFGQLLQSLKMGDKVKKKKKRVMSRRLDPQFRGAGALLWQCDGEKRMALFSWV